MCTPTEINPRKMTFHSNECTILFLWKLPYATAHTHTLETALTLYLENFR